jgi:hypothetical protein
LLENYTDTIDMRTIQFREAIYEAMSEEMRNDETVYLMGEEVGGMVLIRHLKECLPSLEKRE